MNAKRYGFLCAGLVGLFFTTSSWMKNTNKAAVNSFTFKRGTNISHWLSQSSKRGADRENYFTEKDVNEFVEEFLK